MLVFLWLLYFLYYNVTIGILFFGILCTLSTLAPCLLALHLNKEKATAQRASLTELIQMLNNK